MKSSTMLLLGGAAAAVVLSKRKAPAIVSDASDKPGPIENASVQSISGVNYISRNRSRIVRGMSGLGADSVASSIPLAPGAFVAPEFKAGKPGTYDVDVTIEGVPYSEEKLSYLTPSKWTDAIQAQGVNGRVTKVRATGSETAGTAGAFGYGEPLGNFHYRVTVEMAPGDATLSGLGAVAATGWAIVGVAVLVGFLIYEFTGHNILVDAIRFLAGGVSAAGTSIVLPILLVAGAAIFLLNKSGTRVSTPWFSNRGG